MLRKDADGPVLRVTLDRPEVRNALDEELIGALSETFFSLSPDVRAVVLTGAGNAFCAGGDLNWMRRAASYTEEQNYQDALHLARLFEAICNSHALVIAAVNGHAFGGGCGLVAAADVAIAVEQALFSFSEVKLGLVPATISPFVRAKIGPGHARALFATGEPFGADKALRIGLVHEQVPLEELQTAVGKKLESVLRAGPQAVAAAKRLAIDGVESIEDSARLLSRIRASDEAREGISAFLEKRPASFVAEPGARA